MLWKATLRLTYHLSFFVPVEWCCVAPVSSGICVNRSRTMRMTKWILTFPLARMATVTTGKDWRNYVTEIFPFFIKIDPELINILCIHSSVPAAQVVGWCKEMYVSGKISEGVGQGVRTKELLLSLFLLQEIAIKFVYSRQQKLDNFLSWRR